MKLEAFKAGTWRQRYRYRSFEPTSIDREWVWEDAGINLLLETATRALGELNAQQAQVLVWNAGFDYSFSEISAASGMPVGTAKSYAFRARALPVVLVHVTSAADGSDAVPGRAEAPRPTTPRPAGWDTIVDDLAGHPSDIIVTKRNWGAFYGTDLDLHLRRRGVTQIVLAGIATTMGVESTARAAHEHGYNVTLATDAMTDRDAEAHRNSIERIFPRLGETGTTADILDLLASTRS